MMKEKKTYQPITSESIYLAYELLLDKEFISFPLTLDGRNKVEAIVSNINNLHFGSEIYPTIEEKALAYLYFLIKDHPFIDGNKRTACLIFAVICDVNGLSPNFKDFGLDQLAVFIEKIKEDNHQEIIKTMSEVIFKK